MLDIEISSPGIRDWIGPHYFIPAWNLKLIYSCVISLTGSPHLAANVCGWAKTASPGAKYKSNKLLARIRRQHP